MARTGRRPYPPEYRAWVVEQVKAGRSPGTLAREIKPAEQTIRNWVQQMDLDDERRETGRLRLDNERLRVERNIARLAALWSNRNHRA